MDMVYSREQILSLRYSPKITCKPSNFGEEWNFLLKDSERSCDLSEVNVLIQCDICKEDYMKYVTVVVPTLPDKLHRKYHTFHLCNMRTFTRSEKMDLLNDREEQPLPLFNVSLEIDKHVKNPALESRILRALWKELRNVHGRDFESIKLECCEIFSVLAQEIVQKKYQEVTFPTGDIDAMIKLTKQFSFVEDQKFRCIWGRLRAIFSSVKSPLEGLYKGHHYVRHIQEF